MQPDCFRGGGEERIRREDLVCHFLLVLRNGRPFLLPYSTCHGAPPSLPPSAALAPNAPDRTRPCRQVCGIVYCMTQKVVRTYVRHPPCVAPRERGRRVNVPTSRVGSWCCFKPQPMTATVIYICNGATRAEKNERFSASVLSFVFFPWSSTA